MKSRVGNTGGNEAGHLIVAASLGASVAAIATDLREVDGILYEVTWTSTAQGTFKWEISNSFLPNPTKATDPASGIRVGNWTDVTALLLPAVVQPSGANPQTILVGLPSTLSIAHGKFIRFSYTRTGGAGVLDVWIHGKSQGS